MSCSDWSQAKRARASRATSRSSGSASGCETSGRGSCCCCCCCCCEGCWGCGGGLAAWHPLGWPVPGFVVFRVRAGRWGEACMGGRKDELRSGGMKEIRSTGQWRDVRHNNGAREDPQRGSYPKKNIHKGELVVVDRRRWFELFSCNAKPLRQITKNNTRTNSNHHTSSSRDVFLPGVGN